MQLTFDQPRGCRFQDRDIDINYLRIPKVRRVHDKKIEAYGGIQDASAAASRARDEMRSLNHIYIAKCRSSVELLSTSFAAAECQ